MLEVDGISAYYGDMQALENVRLSVPERGVVALVGPNAAGKTTTLRAISGMVPIRDGRLTFDGQSLRGLSPQQIVELGIAHVPEGRRLFSTLTVEENLRLGAYCRRGRKHAERTLAEVYERFPRLAERRSQLAGSLSGGEQQMCAIGRGLMARPRLLMIDEMSLGLAPIVVRQMFALVSDIAESGVSVLLVEQQVQHALDVASHAYVIEKGVTRLDGPTAELKENRHVREAYLGV
jgi:branched-chain amino acid transport system ATP-binding protein